MLDEATHLILTLYLEEIRKNESLQKIFKLIERFLSEDLTATGESILSELQALLDSKELLTKHDANWLLGICYLEGIIIGKDEKRAFEIFKQNQDDKKCQHYLAYCYHCGMGCDRDAQAALKLYQEASSKGFYLSYGNMGDLWIAGKGVAKDVKRGIEHYKQAEAKGCPFANLKLARLYIEGKEVERDIKYGIGLVEKNVLGRNLRDYYDWFLYSFLVNGEIYWLDYCLSRNYIQFDHRTNGNVLLAALIHDQFKMFEHLRSKYKININSTHHPVGSFTIFSEAAYRGKISAMKYLLDNKYFKIDHLEKGFSALYFAALNDKSEMFNFLLSQGSYFDGKVYEQISDQYEDGRIKEGYVQTLIHIKYLFNICELSGFTSNSYTLEVLSYSGSARSEQDGNTPFHRCLQNKNPNFDLILDFYDAHTNTHIPNNEGKTVLDLLKQSSVRFLNALGFCIEARELFEHIKSTLAKYPEINAQALADEEIHDSKDTKEVKETNGNENEIVQAKEEIKSDHNKFRQKILQAEGYFLNSNEPELRVSAIHFILGRLLGDPINTFDADLAREHFDQVIKSDRRRFSKANENVFNLGISGKLSEFTGDQRVEYVLRAGKALTHVKKGHFMAIELFGDDYGVEGIPGFDGFEDTDSQVAFFKYVQRGIQRIKGTKTKEEKEEEEKKASERNNSNSGSDNSSSSSRSSSDSSSTDNSNSNTSSGIYYSGKRTRTEVESLDELSDEAPERQKRKIVKDQM